MKKLREEDLMRFCKNECSQEEERRIQSLIDTDKETNLLHAQLKSLINLKNEIDLIKKIESNDTYHKTLSKIKRRQRTLLLQSVMRYAAFLTLPLLISTLYLGYRSFVKDKTYVGVTSVKAAPGTIVRYELPDKSVVWLNSESKITYSTGFNKDNREIDLDGEAYFEVEANPESPFYVNTARGVKVYAYGTKFNVCGYKDFDYIETTLESGKVNAILKHVDNEVVLKPGELLCYHTKSGETVKSAVDISEKIAWKDGKLIFRNTPLDEVLKRLSRHFNVDIHFKNHTNKEYKYRATFRNETIGQILDYLSQSASIQWKIEDSQQRADGTFTKKKITVDLYQ